MPHISQDEKLLLRLDLYQDESGTRPFTVSYFFIYLLQMETHTSIYLRFALNPREAISPAGSRAFIFRKEKNFLKKLNRFDFIPHPTLDWDCKQGSQFGEEKINALNRVTFFFLSLSTSRKDTPWVLIRATGVKETIRANWSSII